jgi:hypothetical protein
VTTPGQARTDIGELLMLPDVTVVPFSRNVDAPDRRTVIVEVDTVTPASTACPGVVVDLAVWLITPYTDPGPADDDLDAFLGDVVTVLDLAGVNWTTAKRGVWGESYPAYRMTVEVPL